MLNLDFMQIILNKEQLEYCKNLAIARHDAKHASFRNASQICPESKKGTFQETFEIDAQYMPHFVGIVGELAWSIYSGEEVDETIYKVRDSGEDFNGIEVRTITYEGKGEPELKVKVSEFESKKPEVYVLAKFNMKTKTVELLGKITREDFDLKKVEKKYGRYLPKNYIVPLSLMEKI